MTRPRNIVGPQVRALREARGLTQPQLAAKLNLLGWDISRETLAKIEAQIRWVADFELVCLGKALGVPVAGLLPAENLRLAEWFRSRDASRTPTSGRT